LSEFSASDKGQKEGNERNKSLTATTKSAISRDWVKWHGARRDLGTAKGAQEAKKGIHLATRRRET
jgi:hypothetical protein